MLYEIGEVQWCIERLQ